MKKLWRCHVCNDIHLGNKAPEVCPTCGAKNAFVLSDINEAMEIIGKDHSIIDTKQNVVTAWKQFSDQNPTIRLTDKTDEIELLSKGVLENHKNKGQRYCPCRITTGDRQIDLNLICPCNFLKQPVFKETGECWCGLFIKRDVE
ncbi:MAG TPA: ferredoxin-thioredoxin reductase catalytic domain-containing protein [Methanomassiliicoccales archaeon]|nr:ferredoxin-thioredoxin reductase catalytic domain-containing protein [Methanomassiliicoccales archaeon]